MIRHSPCEYYLKYLIAHPKGHTNDDIRRRCRKQQLDCLDDEYLDELRSQLLTPDPFDPFDPHHPVSSRFLLREKIHWLFHPDKAMRQADVILSRPRAKEFVESMLLSGAPTKAIALALLNQHKIEATKAAVDRYKQFYWNVDLCDSVELRAIIALRSDAIAQGLDESNPMKAAQARAMKRAAYSDPRKVAAELPHTPISAAVAQMRMGYYPSRLELALVLEHSRAVAATQSYSALLSGGKDASAQARDFMLTAKLASEVLGMTVRPEDELRDQLSSILLQTDTQQIPTLAQLSEGRHTVDLEPIHAKDDEYDGEEPDRKRGAGGQPTRG